jgi:hypothetical protein
MLSARYKVYIYILAIILQTVLYPFSVFAVPTATAEVYPRLVMAGTDFQLEINVGAVGDYIIEEPMFPTVDGLRLLTPEATSGVSFKSIGSNSESKSRFIAQYRADLPGKYQLGPIDVPLSSSTGEVSKITIAPVTVEVYKDSPKPASDIIHLPMPPWWVYFLGIGLIATGAGGLVWWRTRKKHPLLTAGTVTAIPVSKTLEQNTIDEIKSEPRPQASDIEAVKTYYIKINEILRKYLSIRYNVSTKEMTTWEIQQEFLRLRLLDSRVKGVFVILNDCDWVKFARSHPRQNQIDGIPGRVSQALIGAIEEGPGKQSSD